MNANTVLSALITSLLAADSWMIVGLVFHHLGKRKILSFGKVVGQYIYTFGIGSILLTFVFSFAYGLVTGDWRALENLASLEKWISGSKISLLVALFLSVSLFAMLEQVGRNQRDNLADLDKAKKELAKTHEKLTIANRRCDAMQRVQDDFLECLKNMDGHVDPREIVQLFKDRTKARKDRPREEFSAKP